MRAPSTTSTRAWQSRPQTAVTTGAFVCRPDHLLAAITALRRRGPRRSAPFGLPWLVFAVRHLSPRSKIRNSGTESWHEVLGCERASRISMSADTPGHRPARGLPRSSTGGPQDRSSVGQPIGCRAEHHLVLASRFEIEQTGETGGHRSRRSAVLPCRSAPLSYRGSRSDGRAEVARTATCSDVPHLRSPYARVSEPDDRHS